MLVAATLGVTGVALLFLPELERTTRRLGRARRSRLRSAATAIATAGNLIAVRNHKAGLPTFPATAWGMCYGALYCRADGDDHGRTVDVRSAPPATRCRSSISRCSAACSRSARISRCSSASARARFVHRRVDACLALAAVDPVRGLPLDVGRRGRRRARRGGQLARAAAGPKPTRPATRECVRHVGRASRARASIFAARRSASSSSRGRARCSSAESCRRTATRLGAFALEPFAHVRLRQDLLHFGVEPATIGRGVTAGATMPQ